MLSKIISNKLLWVQIHYFLLCVVYITPVCYTMISISPFTNTRFWSTLFICLFCRLTLKALNVQVLYRGIRRWRGSFIGYENWQIEIRRLIYRWRAETGWEGHIQEKGVNDRRRVDFYTVGTVLYCTDVWQKTVLPLHQPVNVIWLCKGLLLTVALSWEKALPTC